MLASLLLCLLVKDTGTPVRRGCGEGGGGSGEGGGGCWEGGGGCGGAGLDGVRVAPCPRSAAKSTSCKLGTRRHPTVHLTLRAAASRLQGRGAPGQRERWEILLCFANLLLKCVISGPVSEQPGTFLRKVSERSARTSIALRCSAGLQLIHLS